MIAWILESKSLKQLIRRIRVAIIVKQIELDVKRY